MAETQTWILFPKDANKEIAQSIQIKVGKKLEKLNAVVYEAKEIPLLVSSAYDCYPNATIVQNTVKQCDGENDSKPFRLSDWTANLPKLAPNKKVGLIDSGIGKNDATGHGTVMNYIIHQICPEAEIIDLKIFDKNGESTYLTLLEKINDALDVGCQVLNMSLSRKPDTSEELNSQLDGLESQIVKRLAIACSLSAHTFIAAGNMGLEVAQRPAYFSRNQGLERVYCVSACEEGLIISAGSSCKSPGSANCTKAPGSIVHEGSNLFGTSISTAIITGLFLLYNQIPSQDCINQWKDFY